MLLKKKAKPMERFYSFQLVSAFVISSRASLNNTCMENKVGVAYRTPYLIPKSAVYTPR